MRILAIGGTGFIGRFAVPALLEHGHHVTIFHRGSVPAPAGAHSIAGDRRELRHHTTVLRDARPDVVIDFLISNQRQAVELLDVFRGLVSNILMLSSCDVYRAAGILHGTEPGEPDNSLITEDSPLRTRLNPYPPEVFSNIRAVYPWVEDDYDKIPAERAVLDAAGTVLRLPMIYGPGDPLRRFQPLLHQIAAGAVEIPIEESTAQWRAIRGYVENVAWAVALAGTSVRAAGRVYNVGDPENFTELEWQRQIAGAAGWHGRFVLAPGTPVGNMRQHWVVDTTRIRTELGYREPVPLAEAIRRTVSQAA
jgi:nucleoside-diphosphate-sugar epimerase